MKRCGLITVLMLLCTFYSYATNRKTESLNSASYHNMAINDSSITGNNIVYVCTGSYAYAYHSRIDCPGLSNCQGEIKYTEDYNAVYGMNRVPCCRCWSNVSGRCKDDNPNYGGYGGDNSEAYAYMALGFIVVGAALLSNDIYLYRTHSFNRVQSDKNKFDINANIIDSVGWVFGFRKTFKHCALEYGASYLQNIPEYYFGRGKSSERWGAHLNFVHHVFYNKTPERLKIYLGPTINYVYQFGYGGICGIEYKLFDRLRADLRYEFSTQTNQIQLGLIFNYQKRYFWQK